MTDDPVSGARSRETRLAPLAFDGCELLAFPMLAQFAQLTAFVTTRPWNLAPHRGPDAHLAVDRRRRLCEFARTSFERLTAPDQIHSHHVVRIHAADVGAGRHGRADAVRFVDGLVCDLAGTPLLQLSGDCPLILVYDPMRHAIGTVHASWRGTVAGAATQVVRRMVAEFSSRPESLWAAIAPCAGFDRYEVGEDVRRVAETLIEHADAFLPRRHGRTCFDLKAANFDQLRRAGVPAGQIQIAAECTLSDERFYSHRRDGADTGRFGLFACIRGR